MSKWEIRPLHVGTLHRKRSNFLYWVGSSDPIDVPVLMFLLESGDNRVLVDTGCADPATAYEHFHPFERPPDQHPLAVLKAMGIEPESIKLVINTHLHWDHCYGNDLFPWARFVVQREELRYAVAPPPFFANSYCSFLIGRTPPWMSTRFDVLDGDTPLLEGLSVLLMPGHTPGMQSVLVEAETGQYILPSDNVGLYENWEGKPPTWPHIPANQHVNLLDYLETFRRMEATGARVIPGHDFRVLDTAVYR